MKYKFAGAAAVLAIGAVLLSGCSGTNGATAKDGKISGDLTVWSYAAEDAGHKALDAGFKKKYPDVNLKVITQPGDNYYALLQAAVTSGQGPDVFTMFPGGYQQQFSPFSLDLSKYIPKSEFEAVKGQFFAKDSNLDKAVYGAPLVSNMYLALYNQDILTKAGVAKFPTDWTQLDAACKKIVAAGYTCLGYGNENGSGGFDSYEDFSYMSGAAVGLTGWDGLIAGTAKYSNPVLEDQVAKWASLQTKGYTNKDVLTWRDVRNNFLGGKSAILITGSWDAGLAEQKLGAAVHAAPAPFSDAPMNVLIRLQDSGLSASKSTQNPKTAAAYIAYAISAEGQTKLAANGSVPARTGVVSSSPVVKELLAYAAAQKLTVMPMYDNFIAPSVNTALRSSLDQAMAGQLTAEQALAKVDAANKALSPKDRVIYNLAGK